MQGWFESGPQPGASAANILLARELPLKTSSRLKHMSDASPLPASPPPWVRLLRTAAVLTFFAFLFTWLLRVSNRSLSDTRPAGFPTGVLHGICMPAAMPHLLLGHDVPIFAPHNTGRTYKLGYTVGVNGAGLIFFGSFYFRINRLRRSLAQPATPG